MNRTEWDTVAQWFEARWPHALTQQTDDAFYTELQPYSVLTIRTAGEQMLHSGREFLSLPGLVAACRNVARTSREWDTFELPASDDSCSWEDAAERLGVPGMSFAEYARKETG